MVIYLAPLITLVGLILYFAAKNNGDIKEAGRIMFFCGLLATLLVLAGGHAYRLP